MAMLHDLRMRIARTDMDGDVAVTVRDGTLGLRVRGSPEGP
jgi:hypothetical protein